MLRCAAAVCVMGVVILSADPAQAQWFSNFCDGVHRDYHRNTAWPDPFLRPDREATMAPFAIMVANGWRRQNLLSDYHFNDDATQLNQAGELKLQFILTQMPPGRRTVFVQRGATADITAIRVAVVQRNAGRILPRGAMADIVESDLANEGWPADEIDSVTRGFQRSRPEPRLSSSSGGGGSSSGSSSGGSGGASK